MTQLTLDPCANRHHGDPESTEAFKRVDAVTDRALILELIKFRGETGATLDEISELLSRPPNQISGRFSELKMRGLILASGLKRKTRSGNLAKVYRTI